MKRLMDSHSMAPCILPPVQQAPVECEEGVEWVDGAGEYGIMYGK